MAEKYLKGLDLIKIQNLAIVPLPNLNNNCIEDQELELTISQIRDLVLKKMKLLVQAHFDKRSFITILQDLKCDKWGMYQEIEKSLSYFREKINQGPNKIDNSLFPTCALKKEYYENTKKLRVCKNLTEAQKLREKLKVISEKLT